MPPKPKPKPQVGAALAATSLLTSRWVERLLASHDPPVTVAQYLALRAIDAEPLSAAELARRTGVSGPAVSQLVSSLESAGLVSRGAPLEDPRTRELALKPSGKQLLKSATELVGDRLGELLDLPRPEADALLRSLERVDAALTGTAPPRRPPPPRPPKPKPR